MLAELSVFADAFGTALVQTAEAEHIPRELTFGRSELGC